MKICKTSIEKVLRSNQIEYTFESADHCNDASFTLHGEYNGIEISFVSGLAMVSTFDEGNAFWDIQTDNIENIFSAIVEISAK
jgi:hypothetical protein